MANKEIKMVPVKCPHCGAQLQLEESRKEAFCTYCRSKFLIDDGSGTDTINITNNIHNETHTINNYAKRGVVGSVLDYVDKQKDRQEKAEKEARERAQMAREKNAESAKNFLALAMKHWKISLGVVGAIILLMVFSSVSRNFREAAAERAHIEAGEIKIGSSSTSFVGEDYKDVIKKLEATGFTNIEEDKMNDIVFGFLAKEGAVEKVSINGTTSFSIDDWFPANSSVVVSYHTAVSSNNTETAETNAVLTVDEDPREERDAFYDNTTYEITEGLYKFIIPDYWVQDTNVNDYYRGYAETGNQVAMIDIRSDYDEHDPVGFDWLDEQYERDLTFQALATSISLNGASHLKKQSEEIVENEVYKGVLWKYSCDLKGIPMHGQVLMFPSEEDNAWVTVDMSVTDNTLYRYNNDYDKLLQAIKKKSAEEIAKEAAIEESKSTEELAKQDAEEAAKQEIIEKTAALEAEFPIDTAKKVLLVAFTNFEATDVFASDGNTVDKSKLHDSSYNGEESKVIVRQGEWTANDDGTWHVKDCTMRTRNTEHTIKFTCIVAFDGSNYYVKNVTYKTAATQYIDSDDPSKVDGPVTLPNTSSSYDTYFKVSPSLIK